MLRLAIVLAEILSSDRAAYMKMWMGYVDCLKTAFPSPIDLAVGCFPV